MDSDIVIKIIDEVIEEKSNENEGFIIDCDEKAEWALQKIAVERAETQRYINVCQSMILEYEEKIKKAQEKLTNKSIFLEGQLQKYFECVEKRYTKTQQTYKLPSGTLKLKYQQPEFKRDEQILTKWLKENNMIEFVKIEEKPNWSELKRSINISGENAVTHDGLIVDGVKVIDRPPVFEVEI